MNYNPQPIDLLCDSISNDTIPEAIQTFYATSDNVPLTDLVRAAYAIEDRLCGSVEDTHDIYIAEEFDLNTKAFPRVPDQWIKETIEYQTLANLARVIGMAEVTKLLQTGATTEEARRVGEIIKCTDPKYFFDSNATNSMSHDLVTNVANDLRNLKHFPRALEQTRDQISYRVEDIDRIYDRFNHFNFSQVNLN